MKKQELTGAIYLLDRAGEHLEIATSTAVRNSSTWLTAMRNLAAVNMLRARLTRSFPHLLTALSIHEEVLAFPALDYESRMMACTNLSACLTMTYQLVGEEEFIERAIDFARRAVDAAPPNAPWHPVLLVVLADALLEHKSIGSESDSMLEEAERCLVRAQQLSRADAPVMAAVLQHLAIASRSRHERSGGARHVERATQAYRAACRAALSINPATACSIGQGWASWAAQRRAWHEAAEAYAVAQEAAIATVKIQLGRSDKVWSVLGVVDLANEAAYSQVQAGDWKSGVESLERGRLLLLSDVSVIGSTSLSQLRRERGELYERLLAAAGRVQGAQKAVGPSFGAQAEEVIGEVSRSQRYPQAN